MKTPYLMNTETREIYPYTEDLEKMVTPKFVPWEGKVPPPDLERGVPLAPLEAVGGGTLAEPSAKDRIRIIAGVVHLVPKDECTKGGEPGTVSIERLSGLTGVKRAEVTKAKELRSEVLGARSREETEKRRIAEAEAKQKAEAAEAELE